MRAFLGKIRRITYSPPALIFKVEISSRAVTTLCWPRDLSTMLVMLVSWFSKPSQPQRIISGLRETFVKRYIVEGTNKAEMRPEEQSEKAESCRENIWNDIQLKGP